MLTKRIALKNLSKEDGLELLELMAYYKLSYPIGLHKECLVQINDAVGAISTPQVTYTLDDELYVYLHLESNKMIAAMYKQIKEDNEIIE